MYSSASSNAILSNLYQRLVEPCQYHHLLDYKLTTQHLKLSLAAVDNNAPLIIDLAKGHRIPLNPLIDIEKESDWHQRLLLMQQCNNQQQRQDGFSQLKLVLYFLNWANIPTSPQSLITSPLLLVPVMLSCQKDRLDQYYCCALTQDAEVNPVIRHQLKIIYGIELPKKVSLDKYHLDRFFTEFPLQPQWQINGDQLVLGHFNDRKISLAHDYEVLLAKGFENNVLSALFSDDSSPLMIEQQALPLAEQHLIAPANTTQLTAIAFARRGDSYVIQGPTGTGKSQTITNLIADFMAQGKRVLFVSNKQKALEDVYQQLLQHHLSVLCSFIRDPDRDKKMWSHDLQQTLDAYLEQSSKTSEKRRKQQLKRIHMSLQQLENINEMMGSIPELSGISLHQLIYKILVLPSPPTMDSHIVPDYRYWHQYQSILQQLRDQYEILDIRYWSQHPLSMINSELVADSDAMQNFTHQVEHNMALLQKVQSTLNQVTVVPANLELDQFDTMFTAIHAIQPLAELGFLELLQEDSQLFKRYQTLSKQYDHSFTELQKARTINYAWDEKPSFEQTHDLLAQAIKVTSSPIKWLLPAYWKLHHFFNNNYRFNVRKKKESTASWTKILEELQDEQALNLALIMIEDEFKRQFHTSVPELTFQLDKIQNLLKHMPSEIMEFCQNLVQQANAEQIIEKLLAMQIPFASLMSQNMMPIHNITTFPDLQIQLQKIADNQSQFVPLMPSLELLNSLPDELTACITTTTCNLMQLEALSAQQTLQQIYQQNPTIAHFNSQQNKETCTILKQNYQQWLQHNAACLILQHKQRFFTQHNKHKIFNKPRHHQSIQELLTSDSDHVIRHLKPVWLMNVFNVSEVLPLTTDGFDVVIVDEASFISLEEAIPALVRAPQSIVVGNEANTNSLMIQACQHFLIIQLNWHYHSQAESLIHFSNQMFYQQHLITMPDTQTYIDHWSDIQPDALEIDDMAFNATLQRPISFHYIAQGLYDDDCNLAEADYIASLIRALLQQKLPQSIGVIACSEKQQITIQQALNTLAARDVLFKAQLDAEYARQENGQWCGLLFDNFNNMQTDTRDIMILSVGYSANSDFGLIAEQDGEKRLRLTLSGARQHMVVISSIEAEAITDTSNEGMACLKHYLHYARLISQGQLTDAYQSLVAEHSLLLPSSHPHVLKAKLAEILQAEGYQVVFDVGQSDCVLDLAIYRPQDTRYIAAILLDHMDYYQQDVLQRDINQPDSLRKLGWRIFTILSKDWLNDSATIQQQLMQFLAEAEKSNDHQKLNKLYQITPLPVPKPTVSKYFEKLGKNPWFWEVTLENNQRTIHSGRIGTEGKYWHKKFNDAVEAQQAIDIAINKKIKQGYQCVVNKNINNKEKKK